jgi:hypothetical protein
MVLLSDTETIQVNQEKERRDLEGQVQALKRGVREAVDRIADGLLSSTSGIALQLYLRVLHGLTLHGFSASHR